jgi:hypothetical protein
VQQTEVGRSLDKARRAGDLRTFLNRQEQGGTHEDESPAHLRGMVGAVGAAQRGPHAGGDRESTQQAPEHDQSAGAPELAGPRGSSVSAGLGRRLRPMATLPVTTEPTLHGGGLCPGRDPAQGVLESGVDRGPAPAPDQSRDHLPPQTDKHEASHAGRLPPHRLSPQPPTPQTPPLPHTSRDDMNRFATTNCCTSKLIPGSPRSQADVEVSAWPVGTRKVANTIEP